MVIQPYDTPLLWPQDMVQISRTAPYGALLGVNMTKLEILNEEVAEYGLDTYILLKYGCAIFFMLGGTINKYNEILEDYRHSYAMCKGKEDRICG